MSSERGDEELLEIAQSVVNDIVETSVKHRQEDFAAGKLQFHLTSFHNRPATPVRTAEEEEALALRQEQEAAAVLMQRGAHRLLARRRARLRREAREEYDEDAGEEEAEYAASVIQRAWLHSKQHDVPSILQTRMAIVKLQAFARGRKVRATKSAQPGSMTPKPTSGASDASGAEKTHRETSEAATVTDAMDLATLFIIQEIDIFDNRTEVEKHRGLVLQDKYFARGEPRFNSPLYAKAFLQEMTQFHMREASVRRAISNQIEAQRQKFTEIHRILHRMLERDVEAKQRIVRRETRFRLMVEEEESLHWGAVLRLHYALLYGEEWADMYSQLSEELLDVEAKARKDVMKAEIVARSDLAVKENADSKKILRDKYVVVKPAKATSSLKSALEYSRENYGFSSGLDGSLVDLKSRRAVQQLELVNQNANRASSVRAENQFLEDYLTKEKTRSLSRNFANAIKQRDESKARRKHWKKERQEHLDEMRQRAKAEEMASRRTVHEQRHPEETDVFIRLLTPIAKEKHLGTSVDHSHPRRPVSQLHMQAPDADIDDIRRWSATPQPTSKPPPSRGSTILPLTRLTTPQASRSVFTPSSSHSQRQRAASPMSTATTPARSPAPTATPASKPASSQQQRFDGNLLPNEVKLSEMMTKLHVAMDNDEPVVSKRKLVVEYPSGDAGLNLLDDFPDVPENIEAAVGRVLRWNQEAKQTISAEGGSKAASKLLDTALSETKLIGQQLRDWKSQPEAQLLISKVVDTLNSITLTNSAVHARATRQLRLAINRLQHVMELEERIHGHPSVESLLNASAVLVQLEEPGPALSYARKAEHHILKMASAELSRIADAVQSGETTVRLKHKNIFTLAISALHNVAIAQSVSPSISDSKASKGDGIVSTTEKNSSRRTYRTTQQLADMFLGVNHPLTQVIQKSSARISTVLMSRG